MSRRTVALGLVVVLGALGAAAAIRLRARAARGGRRVVAVVPKGTTHEYWQTVHAGARAAAAELGVDLLWQGPATEADVTGQIEIVDDLVNRGVDALVLAPTHADSLVPAIEKAVSAKIPVVIFDSAASTQDYASFVATDNEKGGAVAAEALGKLLGGTGRVALLRTQPGGASTEARERGFRAAMARDFPGIAIVGEAYGMSQRDKSLTAALDLLSAHPDLGGFFASNESSTFGVMRAVEQRGLAGKVRVVGFDAADDLLAGLRAGSIDALVVQDPYRMGREAVEQAVRAMEGKPLERRIDTGVVLVTRDNLDSPAIQARLHPAAPKAAGGGG